MDNGYTRYGNFNTITVAGRISNIKEMTNNRDGSSYLVVTLITTLDTDGQDATITFFAPDTNFYRNGHMPNGRVCTVTGQLKSAKETYEKDGQTVLKQRVELELKNATINDNGWGAKPGAKTKTTVERPVKVTVPSSPAAAAQFAKEAPVDSTPEITPTYIDGVMAAAVQSADDQY